MFMIRCISTTRVRALLSNALHRPNRETRKEFCEQLDQMPVDSHQSKTSACRESCGGSLGSGWGLPLKVPGEEFLCLTIKGVDVLEMA